MPNLSVHIWITWLEYQLNSFLHFLDCILQKTSNLEPGECFSHAIYTHLLTSPIRIYTSLQLVLIRGAYLFFSCQLFWNYVLSVWPVFNICCLVSGTRRKRVQLINSQLLYCCITVFWLWNFAKELLSTENLPGHIKIKCLWYEI